VPWRVDPPPSASRWHLIGLAAFLTMLGLYAVAGRYAEDAAAGSGLYALLGGWALLAVGAALVGYLTRWQDRRGPLIVWPVAALVVTVLTGMIEPDATRVLPGCITLTFAYVGLTSPRWRSLALLPLGIAAFVVGAEKDLPTGLPTILVTAAMWVLVAEVPAWLIARLESQAALLRQIAETDALTQLLDRSTLGPRLAEHGRRSAVILIDLDNFKPYNDRFGHDAGDELLIAFADTLRSSIAQKDMAFRLGGDEFLLMLVGADHHEAEEVLDRVRRTWAQAGTPVSFSAGIASGGQDPMRTADERMYADKRLRR